MLADKIKEHFPNDKWNLTGETYDKLEWFGPSAKPTEAEIDALSEPSTVPKSVPTWAAKIALIDFDLYDAGIAFMDAMTGKDQMKAKVQWENKQTFNRDNALIQGFKASQGMTDADLDNLFTYADQVAKEG